MSLSGTNGRVPCDEEVGFLPSKNNSDTNESNKASMDTYRLLTREDLLQLDSKEPMWRRLRWGLFILFWIVWVGLLLAAILIIVFTPKCPPRPNLPFWRSSIGYWVDPFAFRDSSDDKIGDFKGLVDRLDYIKNALGAGFVVVTSMFSGYYSNDEKILGLVNDFYTPDTAAGSIEDFRYFVKSCHRSGVYVVLTMDFNSVSTKHSWAKNASLLEPYKTGKFSRLGEDAKTTISGSDYYSVFGANVVDLNLRESGALDNVIDVTKFWLSEGIDGILLDNVAFYVENAENPSDSLVSSESQWFKSYPTSQIYTNESLEFVQKIRKVVDEVSQSSGKPKLLAVDAGNTGYGVGEGEDTAMKFLGTKESPGAHAVVSRQFVNQRGWKATPSKAELTSSDIVTYDKLKVDDRHSMILTAASPSDPRKDDVVSLASTLLLPGTSLLYYGSELNIELKSAEFAFDFYPFDRKSIFPTSSNDNVLLSHLAMPWDQSGIGFSAALYNSTSFTNYTKDFGIGETVESASASGRGVTPFSLVQSLISVSKNESMLWGDFKLLESTPTTRDLKFQIFERRAEGFPASIVVLRKDESTASGTFSFSSVCPRIIPRVIYPPNDKFKIGEAVNSERVYLKSSGEAIVYVFDCA
uniref:Glycosyl hydrolase family 13 catalytic domain-containing protein n=1 Tax=Trichobilharzia regenti TaxID=157069 RepID=A0AA85KEZ6_TRIRE|nr:unnamed protein product [Trichobilharzia regenti]